MFLLALTLACSTPTDDSGKADDTGDTAGDTTDRDGDGVADAADCAPDNPDVYPGHYEIPYNGVDEDCDGVDKNDVDADGYVGVGGGGDDCDDSNPDINPGHVEICYDILDNNCDGWEGGEDCDGDGFPIGRDCWDDESAEYPNEAGLTPADVNPDAVEVWYDGTDADCGGDSDWDQDHDGQDAESHAGGDCDDVNDLVNTAMDEVWNDYDDDCDGLVDRVSVSEATSRASGDSGSAEDGLGLSVVVLPDLDSDGRLDLAVSAPLTEGTNSDGETYIAGLVYVLPLTSGIITPKSEKLSSLSGTGYTGYAMAQTEITGSPTLAVGSATGATVAFYPLDSIADGGDVAEIAHDAAGAALLEPEPGTLVVGCAGGNGLLRVSAWSSLSGSQGFSAADYTLESDNYSCADTISIGDADGDGLGELVVGVADDTGATSLYRVDSALRAVGGTTYLRDTVELGAYTYGVTFGTLPDIDGDGYDDLMVSDPAANGTATGDGRVYLLSAPDFAADYATAAYATVSGGVDAAAARGTGVGDLDADGTDDLLVGAPGIAGIYSVAYADLAAGGDHVIAEGVPFFFDTDAGNLFGTYAWAEDLDGDTRDDLIVTSYESPGKISVFFHE